MYFGGEENQESRYSATYDGVSTDTLSANLPNRQFRLSICVRRQLSVLINLFGLHRDAFWTVVFLRLI